MLSRKRTVIGPFVFIYSYGNCALLLSLWRDHSTKKWWYLHRSHKFPKGHQVHPPGPKQFYQATRNSQQATRCFIRPHGIFTRTPSTQDLPPNQQIFPPRHKGAGYFPQATRIFHHAIRYFYQITFSET